MHTELTPAVDDIAWLAIHEPEAESAAEELAKRGWQPEPAPEETSVDAPLWSAAGDGAGNQDPRSAEPCGG